MRITSKSDYALKLLVDLAEHYESGYISLTDISKRMNISKKYLEQIVPMLSKSGLILANRGNKGGYMLNVPPQRCTLGDILTATEGSIFSLSASDDDLQFVWKEVGEAIEKIIGGITLEDIVERRNNCFNYYI